MNVLDKIKEKNRYLPNYITWLFTLIPFILIFFFYYIFSINIFVQISMFFKDVNNNTLAISIAIFGWLIALVLQRQNIMDQQKEIIKYDVYKQFIELRQKNQNVLAKLHAKLYAPFILMGASMIPCNVKIKNKNECLMEALNKWNLFFKELNETYFEFQDTYLLMLYLFEDWMGPIKHLEKGQMVLKEEIDKKNTIISDYINILQLYSNKNGIDWEQWDQTEINKMLEEMREAGSDMGMYLGDFMRLVYNELMSNYFEYLKPIRKTMDEKYSVLIKKGLVTCLETDKKLIKEYKEKFGKYEK